MMFLLAGVVITAAGMPFLVFGILVPDEVTAAAIAGFFSILNTYLNVRMLRQVGATKKASRAGTKALIDLAEEQQARGIAADEKAANGD